MKRYIFLFFLLTSTPLLAQHAGSLSLGTNTTQYWIARSFSSRLYYKPETAWYIRGEYRYQLPNNTNWELMVGIQYTTEQTFAGYGPSTCLRGEGCSGFDSTITKQLTWIGIPLQVNRSLPKLPLSIFGGIQPEIKLTNIGPYTQNARLWNMHLFMGVEVSFLQSFFLRSTAQLGLRSISNRGWEIVNPNDVFYIIPGRLQFGLGYTFAKRKD